MVMRIVSVCVLWLVAAAGIAQDISVTAEVDRARLPLNESLTLVLRAEGQVRGEPDVSALETLFDIRRSSESTRIEIMNGQARQVAEWLFQLMPRRAGRIVIPPIEVAGRFSEAIEVEILPAETHADAPTEVFIEAEISPEVAFVQAQAIYTLRLFVDAAIVTGRATITAPSISGGEAIIEKVGEDRRYRATRGTREFTVLERRYAIFPQRAGTLTIQPAQFEAMIIAGSRRGFSRVERFRSEAIDLEVEPPVPPPASHPNAAWLPASRLTLHDTWSQDPLALVAGEPVTLVVSVEATGLLDTQIPELPAPQADGVRLYADRPETERKTGEDGFVSVRRERFAVLPQTPLATQLPAIELPWFDIEAREWQVARIEPRALTISPGTARASAATAPNETPPTSGSAVMPASAPSSAPGSGAPTARVRTWQVLSALLATAWVITAVLWWRDRTRGQRSSGVPSRPVSAFDPTGFGLEARLRRRVRAEAMAGDPAATRQALLEWAAVRYADAAPRTLGALAMRAAEPLAGEVRRLEAALYARAAGSWRGDGLAAALDDQAGGSRAGRGQAADPLPPLYR